MAEVLHSTPGRVNDIVDSEVNKRRWSERVRQFMLLPGTPRFYDVTQVNDEADVNTHPVTWNAFPKKVRLQFPDNDDTRWEVADGSRDVQDEYLEWSVKRRDSDRKITKIAFTTEGPEYFKFLAENQPDKLLDLYKSFHPGIDIQPEHLYENGVYNPENQWNNSTTTGTIVHMIHQDNTLRNEIDVAAHGTILRTREDGTIIPEEYDCSNCRGYGDWDRNCDPLIERSCHNLVHWLDRRLTVDDPVGSYIYWHSVDWEKIELPEGHDDDEVWEFWTFTRGLNGRCMRAELEVPEGKGYVVGDFLVNGRPLDWASQLADYISISMTVRTSPQAF